MTDDAVKAAADERARLAACYLQECVDARVEAARYRAALEQAVGVLEQTRELLNDVLQLLAMAEEGEDTRHARRVVEKRRAVLDGEER